MSVGQRPNLDQVLDRLKDFQRDSAAYAFRRLYRDPDTTHRFLIADEVGLGKSFFLPCWPLWAHPCAEFLRAAVAILAFVCSPLRSALCRFIFLVLPTNHLFGHCGP